eukprot:2799196-Rhodomonas_salina.1
MHPPIPLYEGGDIMRDCAPDLRTIGWDHHGYMMESESMLIVDQDQCRESFPFLEDVSMCVLERPTRERPMMSGSGSGSMSS